MRIIKNKFLFVQLVFTFMLFVPQHLEGSSKIDSLLSLWNDSTQPDSIRLVAMKQASADYYLMVNPDSAFYYSKMLYEYADSINNERWRADALNIQGASFYFKGDYYNALDFFIQSLIIKEVLGNKKEIAKSLNNIGTIYSLTGNQKKAIDYLERTIEIKKELKDLDGVTATLINLGAIALENHNLEYAKGYLYQCLSLCEETGNLRIKADCMVSIGDYHNTVNALDSALIFFQESYDLSISTNNIPIVISSLHGMAEVYYKKNETYQALAFGNRAFSLNSNLGSNRNNKIHQLLYKCHKKLGNKSEALKMHELYYTRKDSMENEQSRRKIIQFEYQYEYEKKSFADSVKYAQQEMLKDAQLAESEAKAEKDQIKKYTLFGGLCLLIIFAGSISYRFYISRQQNKIIKEQKKEVEIKNKEIMDSIESARRIQSAILPTPKIVKEYLKSSFVLYKPKDIIAGDFYWMEQAEGKTLFAAADCTGHGVPGAMVSVVCNNGLNRAVREHHITTPGEILNKTLEIVSEEFKKSEDQITDGMDIALCSLQNNCLEYAGAFNPLWIIRNGANEVEEIKGDRQSIGWVDDSIKYKTHKVQLQKGDSIYVFSDGFADQFGGEKGKKFKNQQFRPLLLSIQKKSMEEQKAIIEKTFIDWKGDEDQVDDVCIIGVRV